MIQVYNTHLSYTFHFQALTNTHPELRLIAQYYFSGEGKAVRPVITMCMARAINYHLDQTSLFVAYV